MTQSVPELNTNRGGLNESVLVCPACDFDYMHQCGVEVFVRETEDADHGQHVEVDYGDNVEVGNDVSTGDGNPSGRRDGIKLKFWCEDCLNENNPYELIIQQHKGLEHVFWKY